MLAPIRRDRYSAVAVHIGVDATSWHNPRGYGRYTRNLLSAVLRLDSDNHYVLIVDREDGAKAMPAGAEIRRVAGVAPITRVSGESRRGLADMWRVGRALSASEFDVLLFPTVFSFVPVLSHARKIVFIHDTIPERYPELALPDRRARWYWRTKSALARRQADCVVTVSDYSRRQIRDRFGIAEQRTAVVGEAADPIFRPLQRPEPGDRLTGLGIDGSRRRIVFVGGFSPHKNLEMLVAVFARIAERPDLADVQLVFVGETTGETFHSNYEAIRARAESTPVADRIVFTGYLPDEELVVLLNLSTVLVLPSLVEGFGLPGVEAAACGCPVVATRESPLPDLLGEGGLFVDPHRDDELGRALLRLLESDRERQRVGAAALAAASRLTWNGSARQLMEVIASVASAGGGTEGKRP